MSNFNEFREKLLSNPVIAQAYIEVCDEEIARLVLENKTLISEREALKWQLQSAQAQLAGFKAGTKEGADRLRSELKRAEDERDALNEELQRSMQQEVPEGYWAVSFGKLKSERDALKTKVEAAIKILHQDRLYVGYRGIIAKALRELEA